MNKRQLEKALEHFSNGHRLGDVSQFADVDQRELNKKFAELNVTDEYSALKALQDLRKSKK